MNEINEEKSTTITLKKSTLKALNLIKYKEDFESIDDVISNLIIKRGTQE